MPNLVGLLCWTGLIFTTMQASPSMGQEGCEPIRFTAGERSAVVDGVAPPDEMSCYTLTTEAGYDASLEVISGRNVIFSITGVTDAQDRFSFVTEKTTYEISVGQLLRAVEEVPFTMAVRLGGASYAGSWRISPQPANSSVSTQATATDGVTTIDGGCNAKLGRGVTFTISYTGNVLQKIDNGSESVAWEVMFRDKSRHRHEGKMHYFEPDRAHVVTGLLPAAFLDDFARGTTLTLVNGSNAVVAAFALTGTAKLRAAMREFCGI